jgi:aspartyl-tRNA(Asn)/glutamyl-tRNA(Gln) amidotransferase subunit C
VTSDSSPTAGADDTYDEPVALISREDVAHVARLARLDVTDEELDRFAGQLAAVLEHAADLAALDTSGVPPTAHPFPLVNVLREDVVGPSLDRDEVLAMAPAAEDGRFRVPRILGEAP